MNSKFNIKSLFNKVSKNKIATNRYLLYLVAFIAFLDILGYLLRQEFMAIFFFYLVGMITYCFTKNMTIVLGMALIFTTLAHFIKHVSSVYREGMTENIFEEEDDPELLNENDIEDDNEDKDQDENEPATEGNQNINNKNNSNSKSPEKYQNIKPLKPEHLNIPNKEQLKKQFGRADEIETAYDNLEKVVGENGIKSMTKGTKELVKQQKELLNGLKEVTPALNEAMGAIAKIDLANLTDIFNKTNVFNKSE